MMMKLIGNYVLVEPIKEKVKQGPGGIIDKDNSKGSKLKKGTIVAIGTGQSIDGYIYPITEFKVGDAIQFIEYSYDIKDEVIIYKNKKCKLVDVYEIILKGKE